MISVLVLRINSFTNSYFYKFQNCRGEASTVRTDVSYLKAQQESTSRIDSAEN